MLCAVEFCERASYYGVTGVTSNFVNRPLPDGGNGWGAPPRGDQQTAGALGMGTVKANAVDQSFKMLVRVGATNPTEISSDFPLRRCMFSPSCSAGWLMPSLDAGR